MNILTLDVETYFDKTYTLKKLTTEAYIRDPRFQALLLGYQYGPKTDWVPAEDIPRFLQSFDWSNTAVLAHHTHFDGLILTHHYGIRPAMWLDTLSMGRMLNGNALSVSLAALAQHYGVGAKQIDYRSFAGRRREHLDQEAMRALGEGCCTDVALTRSLFVAMAARYHSYGLAKEYSLIDQTIRMFVEPSLIGDQALFSRLRDVEWSRKNELLLELGVSEAELQSHVSFVDLLEAQGVEVEYKSSPSGVGQIPAIARTDDFMKELCEHENPRVAALANARLDVRSTIDETRAGRLADMASRGPMPVYLGYCGAHTTRWSGGDKVNFQNFRRTGELRKGLCAPSGHKIVVVDESQIECRLLNYVAGQHDVVEKFRKGDDPYIGIASEFYQREVTKADKAERGTGKQLELSCGYGAGAASIVSTAKRGTYGPPVLLTEHQGILARNLYRSTHPQVVRLWKEGDMVLSFLAGAGQTLWAGLVEVRPGELCLPGYPPMFYQLEYDQLARQWRRKTRQGWRKIWGGHLVENLIQYLARCFTGDVMTDFALRWPRRVARIASMSHDELVIVCETAAMADVLGWTLTRMRQAPDWAPGIPLDAEGSVGDRYEK